MRSGGLQNEYPDAILLIPIFGNELVYEESDFNETIDRIASVSYSLFSFHMKAREFVKKKYS